jgi:hypothetical protein
MNQESARTLLQQELGGDFSQRLVESVREAVRDGFFVCLATPASVLKEGTVLDPVRHRGLFCRWVGTETETVRTLCQVLDKNPCVVGDTDKNGDTPLHLAARRCCTKCVRLALVSRLLERGADPLARNLEGKTPADVATDKKTAHRIHSACNAIWLYGVSRALQKRTRVLEITPVPTTSKNKQILQEAVCSLKPSLLQELVAYL